MSKAQMISDVRSAKKQLKENHPRVYSKFVGDKDTNKPMTANGKVLAKDLTNLFAQMTDEQVIAAASVLNIINQAVRDVGHKRIFGVSLPEFAANLEIGPPTE